MTLPFGLDTLVTNVGVPFEWIIILVFVCGSLIIAAKNFQISIIVLLVTMAGVFVWFYEKGYNWTIPLIIMFMSFIILALSLYSNNKTSMTGGYN